MWVAWLLSTLDGGEEGQWMLEQSWMRVTELRVEYFSEQQGG